MDFLTNFKLAGDGDSAVVRILYTEVNLIEKVRLHSVETKDGKYRALKCLDENCPLCEVSEAGEFVFIHLWDYTDNTEKVWKRRVNKATNTLLTEMQGIVNDWGTLCGAVLRVTRRGKEFPSYTLTAIPSAKYDDVDKELINAKVAYRMYSSRNRDGILEFMQTGIIPPKPEKDGAVSKKEYKENKKPSVFKFGGSSTTATEEKPVVTTSTPTDAMKSTEADNGFLEIDEDTLPF